MASLVSTLLDTDAKWKFDATNIATFDRTFFVDGNTGNALTSGVGTGYAGLSTGVGDINDWIVDPTTDSSFYYDANVDDTLDSGEQLGFKYVGTMIANGCVVETFYAKEHEKRMVILQ